VAALERTIAFAQMNRIAIAIAKHLKFDVARIAEVFFDIDRCIAERGFGLAPGLLHQGFKLVLGVAHLHPAPAAAAGGLDDHGVADLLGNPACGVEVGNRAVRTRNQRQAQCARGALGFDLVAHGADMFGLGADPDDVMRFDDFGKPGIFRQEAVAGVDRIALGDFGSRDDVGDVEIALTSRRRADADRVIGQPDVHRIGIGGGVHRDRFDPHFMRRTVDAQRNFAAIGDQDTLDCHDLTRSRQAAGQIRPAGHFR